MASSGMVTAGKAFDSVNGHIGADGEAGGRLAIVLPDTRAVRCRLLKQFLKANGNKDAAQWEISISERPKEDRQFLSEDSVKDLREIAHRLGPSHELIYSLGVDNSLRRGDIERITLEEAKELSGKDRPS